MLNSRSEVLIKDKQKPPLKYQVASNERSTVEANEWIASLTSTNSYFQVGSNNCANTERTKAL